MAKGSFQVYQHYLPAVYLKFFKTGDKKEGKSTYVFNKKGSNKKQEGQGFEALNVHKICGENYRHTVRLFDEKDNGIENLFGFIEKAHPDFIGAVSDFYNCKHRFMCHPRKHFAVLSNYDFSSLSIKGLKVAPILSDVVKVDSSLLKSCIIFISQIMCYRLKSFDGAVTEKPKMKEVALKVSSIFSASSEILGPEINIIKKNEWSELLQAIQGIGEYLPYTNRKTLRMFNEMYKKFYRYLVLPFTSLGVTPGEMDVYIFKAPIKNPIVSGDMPFNFNSPRKDFSGVCIFTLTPGIAIIFSSKSGGSLVIDNPNNFADAISRDNVKNAEEYVFSMETTRLVKFTKHIKPPIKSFVTKKTK